MIVLHPFAPGWGPVGHDAVLRRGCRFYTLAPVEPRPWAAGRLPATSGHTVSLIPATQILGNGHSDFDTKYTISAFLTLVAV